MKHLTEAIVQSYLDSELDARAQQEVTAHLAACAVCACTVDEAEREMGMLATALNSDLCVSVPTVQLQERLAVQLSVQQASRAFTFAKIIVPLQAALARFTFAPLNFRIAAAAMAVVVIASIFGAIKFTDSRRSSTQVESAAQGNNRGVDAIQDQAKSREFAVNDAPRTSAISQVTRNGEMLSNEHLAAINQAAVQNRKLITSRVRGGKSEASLHPRRSFMLTAKSLNRAPSPAETAGEKAKAQVMLALHIASAELRLAQHQLQSDAGVE